MGREDEAAASDSDVAEPCRSECESVCADLIASFSKASIGPLSSIVHNTPVAPGHTLVGNTNTATATTGLSELGPEAPSAQTLHVALLRTESPVGEGTTAASLAPATLPASTQHDEHWALLMRSVKRGRRQRYTTVVEHYRG